MYSTTIFGVFTVVDKQDNKHCSIHVHFQTIILNYHSNCFLSVWFNIPIYCSIFKVNQTMVPRLSWQTRNILYVSGLIMKLQDFPALIWRWRAAKGTWKRGFFQHHFVFSKFLSGHLPSQALWIILSGLTFSAWGDSFIFSMNTITSTYVHPPS